MLKGFLTHLMAACIACILVSGCGFQPIYGNVADTHIEIGSYLASTSVVAKRSGELGNRLKNAIEDRLNPKAEKSLYGKAFVLETTLAAPRTPLGIGRTGTISRYDITLNSTYKLYDAETRELLDSGTIRRRASFFNADEKYASYAAEQDAIDRGIKELGEDYKMRLASFFAEHYKLSTVAE